MGALGLSACGGTISASPTTTTTAASGGVGPATSTPTAASGTPSTGPLVAPVTSTLQDGQFLSEVTEADPALATYEQKHGNVALRALLTDGSGFCALLHRGGGFDDALVEVAVGARSEESQTQLPLSVTTFNAIEAVALLTLCPSDRSLLPAAARARIDKLGAALGTPAT